MPKIALRETANFQKKKCVFSSTGGNKHFAYCTADHQILSEDYETAGELLAVCARLVLKCLYLARIDWTSSFIAVCKTSSTISCEWYKVCAKRSLMLNNTSIKPRTTRNCVTGEIKLKIANLARSKMQLQVACNTLNQRQEVYCA